MMASLYQSESSVMGSFRDAAAADLAGNACPGYQGSARRDRLKNSLRPPMTLARKCACAEPEINAGFPARARLAAHAGRATALEIHDRGGSAAGTAVRRGLRRSRLCRERHRLRAR